MTPNTILIIVALTPLIISIYATLFYVCYLLFKGKSTNKHQKQSKKNKKKKYWLFNYYVLI